jgi:hypothetical protein
MTLALASISQAAYTPIAIQSSSYNADVIVESNATPVLTVVTTASIDNGTNNTANTWFEQGYDLANPNNGIPPHGSTFASYDNANFSFTMAPSYMAPNGILISVEVPTGTFTLVNPAAYTTLSFLGMGGNGGDSMNVTVHHQDGTTDTGTMATGDWFNGTTGLAWIAGGRCTSTVNLTTEVSGTGPDSLGNPRIYHREITLANKTSPVTSIDFTYTGGASGSHSDVLAVSGATTSGGLVNPIAVTGYDYDFVVETNAPHGGRIMSQTMVGGTNVWATTVSLDNDTITGNSWYEQGYNLNNDDSGSYNNASDNLLGTGIPRAGTTFTDAAGSHTFKMPSDYTVNNAIYISDLDTYTNDTITLTTPAAYTGLSFLGAAGNGPVSVNYVITHTGGIIETGVLTIQDWFNGSAPAAWIANGRVAVDTAQFANVNSTNYPNFSPGYPRLLENDIVLTDSTDPVVSIYLENTNGVDQALSSGRFSILALSGSAGALPPVITLQPVSTNLYYGSSVSFTVGATANAPITYQWQRGTNGVYVNLSNSSTISGVTSTVLSINPIGFLDQADYRAVATDVAGSAFSGAGTLMVFSTNTDVTEPGDPITGVNISPFGDGSPTFAIDNSMDTKFGANINAGTVAALVVTPAVGLTVVTGLRIYTGSDTTGRDPASYELFGSTDGGTTYTVISSNSITLSDNRNPLTAGEAPDPLSQYVTEVDFSNTVAYSTYQLAFPTEKGSGQVQFDEMELLGVPFTGFSFTQQPTDVNAFDQSINGATFSVIASSPNTGSPTVSWRKGSNGVFAPLSDGGHVSGSQTANLTISPTTFADAAEYVAVAYDGSHYITSSIAHLYIYSTNVDVTQPGDTITEFGDTTGTYHGANASPSEAIDNTFNEYINGGSGFSAAAGFPPFAGPVGVIVTPSVGSTVLAGMRFYPGQDAQNADPSSYVLEGSNDGTNFATIASGPLSLPLGRNPVSAVVDPTYLIGQGQYVQAQEILFSNSRGYTTYRLTFPDVVTPSTASDLEIGEVEFLGVPGAGVLQPVIGGTKIVGGNLSISGSGGAPSGTFTVQTNANLTLPSWGTALTGTFDGSGNFSISLPVSSTNTHLFYRIKTP